MQVIRFSLIGGFIGITVPHIIFFNGIRTVDVGIASAMISGIRIMIYLLSLICKQEIFTFQRFAGVFFGLVGVWPLLQALRLQRALSCLLQL